MKSRRYAFSFEFIYESLGRKEKKTNRRGDECTCTKETNDKAGLIFILARNLRWQRHFAKSLAGVVIVPSGSLSGYNYFSSAPGRGAIAAVSSRNQTGGKWFSVEAARYAKLMSSASVCAIVREDNEIVN